MAHILARCDPGRTHAGEESAPSRSAQISRPDHREQLLYHFVELYEQKTGNQWPFLDDRRPEVPDDLAGLTDPPS